MLRRNIRTALLAFGFSLVLSGSVMILMWDDVQDFFYHRMLVLQPNSISHKSWKSTPVPLYFKVYFWNWTNPEDVGLVEGYKPHFVEMGPYTFIEKHEKVNVSWNINGTVSFRRIKRWWFVPEMSNGTMADNVTSINIVATTITDMTKEWYRWLKYPLSVALLLTRQQLHWTNNVEQLLFEGAENVILRYGRPLTGLTSRSGLTSSFEIPHDKFGFLIQQNNSVSLDHFNMETGENGISRIGLLNKWNFVEKTKHYGSNCGAVRGYYGEILSPHVSKSDVIHIFSPEVCRPLSYYFRKETSYRGFPLYVYSPNERTFDNGTLDPKNKCYCENPDKCQPSGVYSRRSCTFGAPVFISFPHYYLADPFYRQRIEGMEPDEAKHNSHMSLDPKTGVQFDVIARYQVNVHLEEKSSPLSGIYFPVIWCQLQGSLSEELKSKVTLYHTVNIVGKTFNGLLCAGGIILILLVIYYWRRFKKMESAYSIDCQTKTEKVIITETDLKKQILKLKS